MRKLLLEIEASIANALVGLGQLHLCLRTSDRSGTLPLMRPVLAGQEFLLLSEEARISHLFTCGQGGEGFKSHVNADFFNRRGKRSGWHLVCGKDRVPLPCFSPDGAGLWFSFEWSVKFDPHLADAAEPKPFGPDEPEPNILRPSKTPVVSAPLEPRVAGFFAACASPEETFARQIDSPKNFLKNLRMHFTELPSYPFEFRQLSRLIAELDRYLMDPPGLPTLLNRRIVELTTEVESFRQQRVLCLGRVDPVLEGSLESLLHSRATISERRARLGYIQQGVLQSLRS